MTLRPLAEIIVKKLVNNGYIAYFAGGWVRDYVMGHPSEDIDIATSASPEAIQALFDKTIPVGISFGVVIVVIEGHNFEVSTFRKDLHYKDGRRPEAIELSTPEEDAKRRDFTINGMFFDPLENKVIDYVQGNEDIKRKIVRAIGDPHARFEEDRLRMVRACRFAVRFGFAIEEATRRGITAYSHVLYPAVSVERVWQEWKKITAYPGASLAVTLLFDLDLLFHMFGALKGASRKFLEEQSAPFHAFSKKTPSLYYLLPLMKGATEESALKFCDDFKLSGCDREWAALWFRGKSLGGDLVQWAKFLAEPKSAVVLETLAYYESAPEQYRQGCKEKKEHLLPHVERLRKKVPLVASEDLMHRGISPGMMMGKLLNEAIKISITENLHTKEEVLDQLMESDLWPRK